MRLCRGVGGRQVQGQAEHCAEDPEQHDTAEQAGVVQDERVGVDLDAVEPTEPRGQPQAGDGGGEEPRRDEQPASGDLQLDVLVGALLVQHPLGDGDLRRVRTACSRSGPATPGRPPCASPGACCPARPSRTTRSVEGCRGRARGSENRRALWKASQLESMRPAPASVRASRRSSSTEGRHQTGAAVAVRAAHRCQLGLEAVQGACEVGRDGCSASRRNASSAPRCPARHQGGVGPAHR